MSTTRKFLFGLALAACAFAPGYANAATVTFDSAPIGSTTVPFSTTVTLPGYDGSLGNLVAVELSKHFTALVNVSIYNGTGVDQNYTNAFADIPLTVTTTFFGVTWTEVDHLTASSASGTVAPGVNTITGVIGILDVYDNPIPPLTLADFENGGVPITFTVTASAGTYGGVANPGVYFGGTASVDGYLDVTYTTAVPEPATWAMMLLGFASLGFAGVRQAKTRGGLSVL